MVKQKSVALTVEEIEAGKKDFDTLLDRAKEEKSLSPQKLFLSNFEDKLKKAFEMGLSNQAISDLIFEAYKFKISSATIGLYLRENMGLSKNSKAGRPSTTERKNTASSEAKTNKKSSVIDSNRGGIE